MWSRLHTSPCGCGRSDLICFPCRPTSAAVRISARVGARSQAASSLLEVEGQAEVQEPDLESVEDSVVAGPESKQSLVAQYLRQSSASVRMLMVNGSAVCHKATLGSNKSAFPSDNLAFNKTACAQGCDCFSRLSQSAYAVQSQAVKSHLHLAGWCPAKSAQG